HAEDGIRDFHVTGVQTCALPICGRQARQEGAQLDRNLYAVLAEREGGAFHDVAAAIGEIIGIAGQAVIAYAVRHDPQTVGLPAEARKSVVEGKSGTTR